MKALKNIFAEGRSPSRIRTDKGQEFRSQLVVSFETETDRTFAQNTEIKANYVERVIKTIKSKMYRYNYIGELQKISGSYNKTYHRTIGMTPNKVTKGKETNLCWKMYWLKKVSTESKSKTIRKPFRFKVGDKVRITYIRDIFTREYDEKWTSEIIKVTQRIMRGGLPIYRLKDFHDEEIKGTFYQSELQKVDVRDDDIWKIETILKTKGKGNNKQYFIKWLHWPKKFNSWISARDVNNL